MRFLSLFAAASVAAASLALTAPTFAGPPAPGDGIWTTIRVPMRDGITLAMDVRQPAAPGRYPTIMELTPYSRLSEDETYRGEAAYWNAHGYVFAIADVRGTGASGGTFDFFSPQEAKDGAALIGWVARQPWSDGKIGLRGSSYTGTNQWFIAREHPPALKCITPSASLGRPMEDVPYLDGIFSTEWGVRWIGRDLQAHRLPETAPAHSDPGTWLDHRPLGTLDVFATGRPLPLYRRFLAHPTYDAYWRRLGWSDADFQGIDIPALMFTGWFDGTMWGTLWRYREARQLAASRNDMWLVVGPYSHTNASDGGIDYRTGKPQPMVGDMTVPTAGVLPGQEMTRAFYDWCLKGGPRPDWPHARAFITGAGRWINADRWPVASASPTPLYLASDGHANGINGDGRLSWTAVGGGGGADHYTHDPRHPISDSPGGTSMTLPADASALLKRDDVLVYTGPVLDRPVTVIGDVTIELTVATSTRDADFVAQLLDVGPDGRSIKLGSKAVAAVRARYRDGYDKAVPTVPGKPMRVTIQLRAIGHQFLPGHRICIWIGSSFYPFLSVNPGTGRPLATDTRQPLKATQTVFHSAARPSRLMLPIVASPAFAP